MNAMDKKVLLVKLKLSVGIAVGMGLFGLVAAFINPILYAGPIFTTLGLKGVRYWLVGASLLAIFFAGIWDIAPFMQPFTSDLYSEQRIRKCLEETSGRVFNKYCVRVALVGIAVILICILV